MYLYMHPPAGFDEYRVWKHIESLRSSVSPRMRQPASSAIDFQLTLKRLPVKDDLSEQLRGAYQARHHVGRLMREMAGRQTQETLSWAYWGARLMDSPR